MGEGRCMRHLYRKLKRKEEKQCIHFTINQGDKNIK
jgi:hypothetical protein